MRDDKYIYLDNLTIILTGETRTTASITINGKVYQGEVGSPRGTQPEDWIEHSLMVGLYRLSIEDYIEAICALEGAMMGGF